MNKVSVSSPSNIALIKYWGMSDAQRTLPNNASLSMTLNQCVSYCTLAPQTSGTCDELLWKTASGSLLPVQGSMRLGIEQHLQQLRQHFDDWQPLRIATVNSFPTGAGIASSASGFSALALAFALRCGQSLNSPDLSQLARLSGSGSAARSVIGGFVQWPGHPGQPGGPAKQFAPAQHWPLHDLIAMTSQPPIFYWQPATLQILERVRQLRREGLQVCATVDAGPNVHVLCTSQDASAVFTALRILPGVEQWIFDQAGDGPRQLEHHLF
jgi:diphosphomevalonate decarboxylase